MKCTSEWKKNASKIYSEEKCTFTDKKCVSLNYFLLYRLLTYFYGWYLWEPGDIKLYSICSGAFASWVTYNIQLNNGPSRRCPPLNSNWFISALRCARIKGCKTQTQQQWENGNHSLKTLFPFTFPSSSSSVQTRIQACAATTQNTRATMPRIETRTERGIFLSTGEKWRGHCGFVVLLPCFLLLIYSKL